MPNNVYLQIFLLINVFIMGALATIAIRHAYAHFRPHPLDIEKPHQNPEIQLSQAMKARLIEESQTHFHAVLEHSAVELQRNLQTTSVKLNKQLDKLGADIIANEMKRYHEDLERLRKQAEFIISNAQTDINGHQADLKIQLDEHQIELKSQLDINIKAEQQKLIQDIDTKLADSVASFLIETLQHNVDLGAQNMYLTDMLEEHKAEIIKGVTDEN